MVFHRRCGRAKQAAGRQQAYPMKKIAIGSIDFIAKAEALAYLGVIFQEFVVHSIKNRDAEVAKQATLQKTE